MALGEILRISVEDYLQGELTGDLRHEYSNGEVYEGLAFD